MLTKEIEDTLKEIVEIRYNPYKSNNKNIDWYIDIYNRLPTKHKKDIDNLLTQYQLIPKKIVEDTISYRIENVSKSKSKNGRNPLGIIDDIFRDYLTVFLKDDVNGGSLLFLPTVAYVSEYSSECFGKPDNQISYLEWKEGDFGFSTGFNDVASTPAEVRTYSSPSFIENNGITVYIHKNSLVDEGIKEYIKDLKTDLKKTFLPLHPYVACYNIESIFKNIDKLLNEEIRKTRDIHFNIDIKKANKKLRGLIGRIF